MTHIHYITNLRIPSTKANSIQVLYNCESFKKAGIDITLYLPFRFGTKKEKRISNLWDYYMIEKRFDIKRIFSLDLFPLGVFEFIWFRLQSVSFYIFVFFYFLFKKTDVIYTRDPWIGLSLFYKKNKILELHNYPQRNIGKIIYKFLIGRFRKTVVISKGLKQEVLQALVVPDGVKMSMFKPTLDKDQARKKLGLPVEKPLVIYTGSLQRWKGIDVLLRAAKNLKDITFYIVGSSLDPKELADLPHYGNTIFTGHVPYKDIPNYLASADILIIPNTGDSVISAKYTSPLKAFEYMCADRPIVASDVPSLMEIFNHDNAYIFKAGDSQDLSFKIEEALSQGGKRADPGPYSWDSRVAKILNFIKIQ